MSLSSCIGAQGLRLLGGARSSRRKRSRWKLLLQPVSFKKPRLAKAIKCFLQYLIPAHTPYGVDRWIEWEPTSPSIFDDVNNANIPMTGVTSSGGSGMNGESQALFCKACSASSSSRPVSGIGLSISCPPAHSHGCLVLRAQGDTCWAVTRTNDNHRGCGCNSGGWTGNGVYYGNACLVALQRLPQVPLASSIICS